MSNWHKAYECSCGKIYDKSIVNLPRYCKKCGNKMYKHYRLIDPNAFGGYDHVDCKLAENVKEIITRVRFFKREIK